MTTLIQLQKLAETLWENYCEVYPRMVRFDVPTIEFNNRFTSTAGICIVADNKIQLGSKFFAAGFERQMCNVILPHELAHQIDYNLNGWPKGNRWHGKTWIEIMIRTGQKPDTYHTMNIKKK